MRLPDYHIHTYLSDGRDSHDEMLRSAENMGMLEIGFSDHITLKQVEWAMNPDSIPQMVETVEQLKRSSSEVKVKLGAEIDYFPGKENDIGELLSELPLDYAIGSVHFIGDWNFDTNILPYDQLDIDRFYTQYFTLIQQCAQSGLFDIIGHCDLAKKFGYRPDKKLDKLYENTARIFSDNGVVVELNTSGLDKPCSEFYPSEKFLEILHHFEVPVTLGSDAHIEQNIGKYFDRAVELLRQTGYSELVLFTRRKREYLRFC